MAIIPRTRKGGKKVWYVTTYLGENNTDWSDPFTSEREAKRHEKTVKRQLAEGTFRPNGTGAKRFGFFFTEWLKGRKTGNAEEDRQLADLHIKHRSWLMDLALEEIEPPHGLRLVEELKATISEKTGKPLSQKYVSNLYGLYTSCIRTARARGLIKTDPCVLERGVLRRKARRGTRPPYTMPEVETIAHAGPLTEGRMWSALAFYLGGREGEICGRRFRDLNVESQPLACMAIVTQYDDQPLKTEDETGEHARKVPVHPRLAELLDAWWREGFEWVYCRKPRVDDFIVPRRFDKQDGRSLNHTKSSAYKLWRAHLEAVKVPSHTLHASRHTFISFLRRGGAEDWVVERMTHNARGEQIDEYTHTEWVQLCQAVLGFWTRPGSPAPTAEPRALPPAKTWSGNRGEPTDGGSRPAQHAAPTLLPAEGLDQPAALNMTAPVDAAVDAAQKPAAEEWRRRESNRGRGTEEDGNERADGGLRARSGSQRNTEKNRKRSKQIERVNFLPHGQTDPDFGPLKTLPDAVQEVLRDVLVEGVMGALAGDEAATLAALERGAAAIDGAVGGGAT